MTYPGDGRNTVAGIFPEESSVIDNPYRGPFPIPERGAKTAQNKREPDRERSVANLSGNSPERKPIWIAFVI